MKEYIVTIARSVLVKADSEDDASDKAHDLLGPDEHVEFIEER